MSAFGGKADNSELKVKSLTFSKMTYTAKRLPIARSFAGYWPYGLIQSVATKIKMKAIANATKEKVISFVRLCMIAPPVRLPFWSVERLADFFRTIVRLPPITNCH